MSSPTIDSTTQQFLDIFDITNNFVIMKDGTTSVIIAVDAMNFGLLAEEEQDSIMYAYAGLLNSLNYTIQILIRSQTKDVTGYLKLLKEQEDTSLDRNKQKRIQKYREFVSNLIRERNVLDKKFFVIIPAQPVELGVLPPSSILPGKGSITINSVDRNIILEKARNILEPKRDHLIAQFARIGLYSRQLETQEIIQLFYVSYNPEASDGQQIGTSNSYTPPMVTAKVESSLMNNSQIQSISQRDPSQEDLAVPQTRSDVQSNVVGQNNSLDQEQTQVLDSAPVSAPTPTPEPSLEQTPDSASAPTPEPALAQTPTPEQTTGSPAIDQKGEQKETTESVQKYTPTQMDDKKDFAASRLSSSTESNPPADSSAATSLSPSNELSSPDEISLTTKPNSPIFPSLPTEASPPTEPSPPPTAVQPNPNLVYQSSGQTQVNNEQMPPLPEI